MLVRRALALLSLLFAGCATAHEEPSNPTVVDEAVIADGELVVKSVHSGKCLEIAGASRANGAGVQQWDCNGTAAQVFRITSVGDGFYQIVNPNSGKALDVYDWRRDARASLQQWEYLGGAHQQFQVIELGSGEIGFRARHSGLMLDVSGASRERGAPIIQWSFHGGANQRWRIEHRAAALGGDIVPLPEADAIASDSGYPAARTTAPAGDAHLANRAGR